MSRDAPGWLRFGTLFAGLLFLALPLPTPFDSLRPHLLALALAYWALEAPGRGAMAVAWTAGLLADVVGGTLLGEQALRMAVLVFLVQRFRAQLRFFPLWQQSAAVGLLLLNDLALMASIRLVAGAGLPGWGPMLAPLVGLLVWPWWFLLLDALRLRHRERGGR
ncbi:MAG TPA: rod shape-determining protein MreD [Xanthomonadaceae bacterium]|nr:rod shape-determining protein MreD [Xanthomonadaceae bacterium]